MSPPQHQTLSTTNAGAGASGIAGYLFNEKASAAAKTGYYLRGEAPSQWLGRGAAAMDLHGEVERERFMEMLQGRFPDGSDLSNRKGGNGKRRAGSDVTWSPPKSFSCHAVHDPRLQALWREAQTYMVGLMEQEVAHARNGKGGADVEHSGNLIVAAFQHEDARPVNGRVTPDWHTHFYLLNATRRADGKMTALHQEWGREGIKLLDFAGKAWLAQRVQELGYEIRATADGFEIVGMSRAQIEHMSPRKGQIDKALQERGLTRENSTSGQRDTANLSTREDKRQIGRDEQHWEWRRELREMGLNMDQMRRDAEARGPIDIEDRTAEAVQYSADHLGERDTVNRVGALRLEALRAGMGHTTLERVDDEIGTNREYIRHEGLFTTESALAREARIIQRARDGRGRSDALMSAGNAAEFIERINNESEYPLTPGQREALNLALTSQDQTFIIRGAAGVGKTKAILRNFVEKAAHEQGYDVVGLAPTSSAEEELREATGPEREQTRSVASFLASTKAPRPIPRIYIIDEAGMISDRDMDRMQAKILAQDPGSRIILTGDQRQIPAVEAGRPLERLMQAKACDIANVSDVVRQRDPKLLELTQALADERLGDVADRIEQFTQEIEVEPRRNKKGELMVDDEGRPKLTWNQKCKALAESGADRFMSMAREERSRTLLMCPTNAVRERINERVRSQLIKLGEVDISTSAVMTVDRKVDMTRAQKTNSLAYKPGMQVDFPGAKRGEVVRFTVEGALDRERVQLRAEDGSLREWRPREERAQGVHTLETMSVAPGDRLVYTEIANHDGKRIANGTRLEVTGVDREAGEVVVRNLADDSELRLNLDQTHALDRGWALTVHKAQGKGDTTAIFVAPVTDRVSAQIINVGATRGIQNFTVITDNTKALQKRLGEWAKTATAGGLKRQAELAGAEGANPFVQDRERIAAEAARSARQQERPRSVSAPVHEPVAKQKEQVHVRERTRED
ncbi:MAG: MobF family relaxase [Acidihalobacter sp.]|uniref:MobF family relaxase n=1 Tax=Acidihalobacter sp. TaxID=1872108 RepID=UPI00307D8C44